jgi:hypothetical protein
MIDTLKLSKQLQTDADLEARRADAIVEAIASAMASEQLVTRDHLEGSLGRLEARLTRGFATMMVTVLLVQAGLVLCGVYLIINSAFSHWQHHP